MYYVYLPTEWCRKHHVGQGSKVALEQDPQANLVVMPNERKSKNTKLELNIQETDEEVINKLIVACYVNPLSSFTIHLQKKLDLAKLLHQKRLVSIEAVEFDHNTITCDSNIEVQEPLPLLKTIVKKVRNLLMLLETDPTSDLINRYEEEVDRSKMLVNKSVLGFLTKGGISKNKVIELYYILQITRMLEGFVDNLIVVEDKKLVSSLKPSFTLLHQMFEEGMVIDHVRAIAFLHEIKRIKDHKVTDIQSYHKVSMKRELMQVAEVLMNWAITNEVELQNSVPSDSIPPKSKHI